MYIIRRIESVRMKKYLIIIILLIVFFPSYVNAEKSCDVVVGDGKSIGSEIACGNEHFYVIGNDGDTIRMLAKYNLYVGSIFNKINNNTYIRGECIDGECNNNLAYFFEGEQVSDESELYSRIREKYNISDFLGDFNNNGNIFSDGSKAIRSVVTGEKYTIGDKEYQNKTIKLYPYTTITENTEGYALQNKLALGVTGEKGNAKYPLYGTLTLFPAGNYDTYFTTQDSFEHGYKDMTFNEGTDVIKYLNDYRSKLNDKGYSVSSIDMLSVKDVDNLVNLLTNKRLPLSDWYNESLGSTPVNEDNNGYYTLGDLKQFLSTDYSWLWNTSYWTKTLVDNNSGNYQVYFISSSGEICYSTSDCFSGIPRAGLRPVVTINKSNIKYIIRVVTDGNGTVEAVDEASGGDTILFKVSNKKGYKLSTLTVTTDSGEKVKFSEEDIVQKEDGAVSISTNKFTMPYENLTITAKWAPLNSKLDVLTNPKTWGNSYIFTLVTMFLASGVFIYSYEKKKKMM